MSDRGAIVVALGAVAGAWFAVPVPALLVGVTVATAFAMRRTVLVVVAVGLLVSMLGAHAEEGMEPPPVHRVSGVATLVTDPQQVSGAVRVGVRLGGRHLDAWARGSDAALLSRCLAGERVVVHGTVGGRTPDWLRVRHVVSRLQIDDLRSHDDGSVLARAANALRRTLARGAGSLDPDDRALFTGLVIGDDREQSVEVTDDFRGAGLSHLLAVSGQNVAFVLAVVAPLLSRLGLRSRLVGLGAVLLLFATITRYEPSVLRATAMAALAGVAMIIGRPVRSVRVLALATTMLLAADPFLVRSVGFGLSVAASAGIVLFSARLADVLPGGMWWRAPLSVLIASQLGVAPLLLLWFDDLPIATLPANLLAEPVAGFVMVWGASAGILVGVLPPVVGAVVHLPTELALWWIAGVARRCTDARLGSLGPASLVIVVGLGLLALAVRSRRPRLAAIGLGAAVAMLVTPAIGLRVRGPMPADVASAGVLRVGAEGLELDVAPTTHPSVALRTLRAAGVDRLARLTLPDDGRDMQAVAAAVERRVAVDRIVYPPAGRDP